MSRAIASRADFTVWREVATRWADNDSYGHVNNTVYYEWFDTVVNAWMIDEAMLDVAAGNPIALVVETRCSFAAPLAFPELVDIGIAVVALGRSSIRYRLGVFAKESDSAAAQGEFAHVVVDRTTRRPIEIPHDWRCKLEAIS